LELETRFFGDQKLPIVLTHEDIDFDIINWSRREKVRIRALLSDFGAILFRGFSIKDIEAFECFAEAATSGNWVEYLETTSPRDHVKSHTSTSTRYNNKHTIFFHNEKSYSAEWPQYVFFYCDLPPGNGGETPISDCRAIYNDIPEEIRLKFQAKKLMYVRRFSNSMGIPWKKAFNVEDKIDLERFCQRNYIEDLSWAPDGTPVLKYVRNTSVIHPITNDKCWFNHGTFFNAHSLDPEFKTVLTSVFGQEVLPYNTYYGYGEEIEEEVIMLLRGLYEKHSSSFKWQSQDVLMLDNILVAHGRNPFEGERSILVTMTEPVDYADTISF